MEKKKGPTEQPPEKKGAANLRTPSRRQLMAVGPRADAGKTVLFDYLRRPTREMQAVRPQDGRYSLSSASLSSEQLGGLLSASPAPSWDDAEAPATVPPRSAPPHFESVLPASELSKGVLTRVDGPEAGRVHSLPQEQLIVGRSRHADLHIVDDGVSRKHARICSIGEGFVVEDLGSQNGTFVGGEVVECAELTQGDVVRFGPIATFRFCWMDAHQESLLKQLYETSVRDGLTGAFNRRYLTQRIQAELAYSSRHKTDLSLLLLDVDHFKRVNDDHGHVEGDRVLREIAVACEHQLRTEDTFARYGGEEFAALLRGIPLLGAVRAAERLREAIQTSVAVGGRSVTVSIGCAAFDRGSGETCESLLLNADKYLYEAKQRGRNRVCAIGYSSVVPEKNLDRAP